MASSIAPTLGVLLRAQGHVIHLCHQKRTNIGTLQSFIMMHGETQFQDAIQILKTHYCMKIKMLEFLATVQCQRQIRMPFLIKIVGFSQGSSITKDNIY
jgi:hypothetical protein